MTLGYRILMTLIKQKTKNENELGDMADMYYGKSRITAEEYGKVIDEIRNVEQKED